MASDGGLNAALMRRTSFGGLRVWAVIGACVVVAIVLILILVTIWVMFRRRRMMNMIPDRFAKSSRIPEVPRDIRIDTVSKHSLAPSSRNKNSERALVQSARSKSSEAGDSLSHCSSGCDEGSSGPSCKGYPSCGPLATASPLVGLPEFSQLGWGHWFTLRDLEHATNGFSKENVIGEGGYGVVYRGRLSNGTVVAVKKLLNNLGQAEKEFRVEVEAIGHVRHKNLVRLLGYCIEGTHRMLVYEFVNNGNLDQWLHGAMRQSGCLSWDNRLKVILGTAKALAYLHEAIEPKVVHRDIKSSNILIDDEFDSKISDFGLAKLLGSGNSHVNTRVMGTFGYVAPEYANTGLLNEKSDVYSFGVLFLEAISGRDPVDYGRPANEVHLVEWIKTMVGGRRIDEIVDPNLDTKPTARSLKRSLLVSLKCVDPDAEKRPKMSQVVQMLEAAADDAREDRRSRRSHLGSMEIESSSRENDSASVDAS